jgi:S-formylglutathione hydrolase
MRYFHASALPFCLALPLAFTVLAETTQQPRGSVERIKVHGKSLEGNLEGDSPDRDVSIYLPPSYKTSRNQRYPVVYMLHGYTDSDERWFGLIKHFIDLPVAIDKSLAGGAREMIVVMPNAYTRYQGSMYSNSLTTGDWETYVAKDLVAYVDSHYRTMANDASRGLAGHSMGGYGTMRIGMKYPDIFSSIYALSPCCMVPNMNPTQSAGGPSKAEGIHSIEELEKADFGTKAQFASAAAWAPNPKNPPFFFDLPTKNGELQTLVLAKFAANAPLAMVDQYLGNLKRLHAIAFDAGDKDTGIAGTIKTLDEILKGYDLPHTFEIYEGTHTSAIPARIELKTMPFFTKNLAFEHAKH